ncbi:MAG: hypothetical protein PF541_18960 [Prolixibacteraceae bacterium]|jgi:hypothetical protein|nr:hypothetical protein [Prolixibacteraceae bacterium]
MKTRYFKLFLTFSFGFLLSFNSFAQPNTLISRDKPNTLYVIEKQNGVKFIGKIISQDAREVLLETENFGNIYIPKHVIKEIQSILPENGNNYVTDDIFASRYFITTNGLPLKKGENYILWNTYGPDFQFGLADNLGIGIMTTWLAMPIIGTLKYSIPLGENKSMALGLLAGTGSWQLPELGLILPFTAFTYGNRINNINLSVGYGLMFYEGSKEEMGPNRYPISNSINETEGRFLISIAGMKKINDKLSLVFDSFISPWGPKKAVTRYNYYDGNSYYNETTGEYVDNSYYKKETTTERSPALALLLPGIRYQIDPDRAFQFGFTGLYFDNEFVQFPIPMVQWFRRL